MSSVSRGYQVKSSVLYAKKGDQMATARLRGELCSTAAATARVAKLHILGAVPGAPLKQKEHSDVSGLLDGGTHGFGGTSRTT